MWLKMIPTGLGMTTRTKFGDHTETAHSLTFTLQLAGQDSLKLETGEVFQNPAYASVSGDKQNEISAQLNLRPASDEHDPSRNEMRYFEAVTGNDHGSASFIHFEVSTPASDYGLLINNIRGGITPSSVTVGLRFELHGQGSPVELDAPNGSTMIWRNAMPQNRRVAIEDIEFHYRLIGADREGEDANLPMAKASIDAAYVAIVAKLADLEKAFVKGSALIVTVIVIACTVLYFARH